MYYVGVNYTPIAYTIPNGLQSVNGSSSTGGCQPEACIMMPYGASNINVCDCPGTAPVNGTLIDGVIPSIDISQHEWASELFVVNRNGQDSLMIGFEFSHPFFLRYVEVVYLDCPVWGIGSYAVNVYSSYVFPAFVTAASTNIGIFPLAEDIVQSCSSLRTISIPLQPTISVVFYFIEFTFGGSSIRPINWLHMAEIRFSDMSPTIMMPTTLSKVNCKYYDYSFIHVAILYIVSSTSTTSIATTVTALQLEATTTTVSSHGTKSAEDDMISTTLLITVNVTTTERPSQNIVSTMAPTKINISHTISGISLVIKIEQTTLLCFSCSRSSPCVCGYLGGSLCCSNLTDSNHNRAIHQKR